MIDQLRQALASELKGLLPGLELVADDVRLWLRLDGRDCGNWRVAKNLTSAQAPDLFVFESSQGVLKVLATVEEAVRHVSDVVGEIKARFN